MNKPDLIVHDYKGFSIPQRKQDGYVNLTNMAKVSNNRRVHDWVRLAGSKDYVREVSRSTGFPADQLIIKCWDDSEKRTVTWAHKLIAITFAKWVSPSFAVWCNQHLLELMETGTTSLDVNTPNKDTLELTFEDYLEYLLKNREILSRDKELAKVTLERLINKL